MCAENRVRKSRLNNMLVIYLLMITLGIISGLSDIKFINAIGLIISDIFIKIFQCISLPIIVLSLIVTISNFATENAVNRVWQRTLFYTLSTTVIAATVSCLLYLIINPSNVNSVAKSHDFKLHTQVNYLDHLSGLVPTNIFAPFIEHQVMGVLLIGIVFGIAIRYIPDADSKKSVRCFFLGMHGLFMVITRWVVKIIPIGLYGFIAATVLQLREGVNIRGIEEYLAVVVFANLIQGFIILPTWLKLNRIKPFAMMRKMMPALSVAFFSKSSAGTLPITIDTAEKRVGINPQISRFVLPLCTSLNMNGCAAFIFATVIYLMQNHGIDITLSTMLLWIVVATIAAIGNAGVPMGCFFLSASLLSSMNVPITLLGIILPFYSIIDMIETSLNVWSDSCVTKVVNDKTQLKTEILPK